VIIVQLHGGLGNQLFGYAFARFLSRHHNTELWIDKSAFHPKYDYIRNFELCNYSIRCHKILEHEERFDFKGLMKKYGIEAAVVADIGFRVDDVTPSGPNIILCCDLSTKNGYLFEDEFRSLLLKELRINRSLDSYVFQSLKDDIEQSENPVSVQVRRGDYKGLQHVFHLVGEEYYEHAFEFIESRVSNPKFFIFSDEIEYVRTNMNFDRNVTFAKPLSPIETLELARTCKHFVSANSTFSWWSAYLSEASTKIVLFPKKYFTSEEEQLAYENDFDYVPSFWIKI
jgi:glycosyl transferase family 11